MKTVHRPTRNPLRVIRAVWRTIRDLGNTEEALTVEMAFFRSRLLRPYARWDESARELRADPRTAAAFERRPRIGRLDLETLGRLPAGTLGYVFANYVNERGLNPYLFEPMPDATDGEYVMAHLLETHDIWHIVTGSETDVAGEFRLVSFYAAQTGLSSASMLLTLGFANTTLFAPDELPSRIQAVSDGWQLGKRSQPLFGTDWNALWDVPLSEVRRRFALARDEDSAGRVPVAA